MLWMCWNIFFYSKYICKLLRKDLVQKKQGNSRRWIEGKYWRSDYSSSQVQENHLEKSLGRWLWHGFVFVCVSVCACVLRVSDWWRLSRKEAAAHRLKPTPHWHRGGESMPGQEGVRGWSGGLWDHLGSWHRGPRAVWAPWWACVYKTGCLPLGADCKPHRWGVGLIFNMR